MRTTFIIVGLAFITLAAAAFFYFHPFLPVGSGQIATTTAPLVASTSVAASKPSASLPPTIPAGYKEYRNEQYHFSVYYPPTSGPPKEYPDRGAALTVSFQGAAGQPGFQIYIAPINGTQITPERFKLDAPSGVMKNPVDTSVDGVVAQSFYGHDAQIGDTREIWFIYKGFLYEITTYKELAPWLATIMQTWKFL